jgi:site-specific recombinase XerD
MEKRILTNCQIQNFSDYLVREEKSNATCEKYIRDIRSFQMFAGSDQVTKECVVAWKKKLVEQRYAVRSINSMLASVNSFFVFLGWHDCKVKSIRLQHRTYCAEEKELKKAEYLRHLEASKKNEQLNLVLHH